jgi:tetratricopeptide (TPR) repeat protein
MIERRRERGGRDWGGAVAACALTLATAGAARASPPVAEHAAAVESFQRGTTLVEAGKMQEAIEAFRDALQHEPASVGARLNLADCYEKIGSPASAWREYTLAESYAQRANDPRRALARSSAALLEPRLLVVALDGRGAPGASIRIDGEPVAPEILMAGTIAVAPGTHRLDAVASGKKRIARDVSGAAGEKRSFALEDEPREPSADAGPGAWSKQRTWGLVVGGVGLAGLALGAVAGGVAMAKKSTLEDEQHDPTVGAQRFNAQRATAGTLATTSTVGFIAGGMGLAVGATLYLTAPTSSGPAVRVGILRGDASSTLVLVVGSF